eukprot:206728_1
MSTFSQPLHNIYWSLVTRNINCNLQNCPTHLNNNETADKTAHTTVNGNIQSVTTENTLKGHKNSTNESNTKNKNNEKKKCPMIIIWNNYVYYSYQSVDPPPDQLLSSNMIIMVGFAVDPPPDQLTPFHIIIKINLVEHQMLYGKQYCSVVTNNIIIIVGFAVDPPPDQLTPSHIIIIISLVEKNQTLYEKHYSSVVTNNNTNLKTIYLIVLNNGFNININIRYLYAAAVGLNLHTITKQGASSTLDATYYNQTNTRTDA